MNTAEARRGAALFDMGSRGAIAVTGEDRDRWLNGMVSNDVAALAPEPQRSGCYAAVLTPQGRIVADVHVLDRGDAYWLEVHRESIPAVVERLERFLIADDVELRDASGDHDRIGLEGARARAVLEARIGGPLALARDCIEDAELAGHPVSIAAFGWSGEEAFQIFAPAGSGEAVAQAIRGDETVILGSADLLEVLRIEAGIPQQTVELAEDTLPDEARIGHAVSDTKGCYTGQEVIARLRSRGGVKHRLVGLRGERIGAPGARIERPDGKATGELTSRCRSELAGGEIALGFVHRDDAEPGTALRCEGRELVVAALPFVALPAPPAPA